MNRCMIHGYYAGLMCPSCNTSIPLKPSPATAPQLGQNAEVVALNRVAAALEKIAALLEARAAT